MLPMRDDSGFAGSGLHRRWVEGQDLARAVVAEHVPAGQAADGLGRRNGAAAHGAAAGIVRVHVHRCHGTFGASDRG